MSGTDGLLRSWQVDLGPLALTDTVLVTWIIMLLLVAVSWFVGHRLRPEPGRWQTMLEGAYEAMFGAISDVLPERAPLVFPFIASLWVFVVIANLVGIIPGVRAPTSSLSTTTALALLVFLSVHWYGIRVQGLRRYLAHYLDPNPLLLPFTVVAEITRTLAMAIRLFGNMMSLGLTAALVLMVAGFLAPIPILMLHIVEALVQAYIFGMLALIYIAGGLQVQELQTKKE
ncbi:MAG TPA: F0F1 ATP synthase subunit A [Terriglobales bacterium]|nr:F0F1 ATP synthase subunit A [Terriglobales bacterium]